MPDVTDDETLDVTDEDTPEGVSDATNDESGDAMDDETNDETETFVERFAWALLDNDVEFLRTHTSAETTIVFRGSEQNREEMLADIEQADAEQTTDRADADYVVTNREIERMVVGSGAAAVFVSAEFDPDEFLGIEPDGRYRTRTGLFLAFDGRTVTHVRGVENREELLSAFGFLTESMSGETLSSDLVADKIRLEYRGVLMRVLRHNIRNEVDVIGAVAEQLADRDSEMADLLQSATTDLTRAARKARQIERDLLQRESRYESVAVGSLLDEVLTDVIETVGTPDTTRPTADVSAAPEQFRTDPRLFRAAVREVLENAVRHTDDPEPQIDVRVTTAEPADVSEEGAVDARGDVGDGIAVVVTDDGPGIPDSELTPIQREGETDLQHSSGVGLWRVKWSLERLGGDVRFETPPDGGTRVWLVVPDGPP